MAQIAAPIAGISAGLGAVNSMVSGTSAANQSNDNASAMDQYAKNLALQTGSQVSQIRNQGAQVMGQQSAAFADNGTGTGGSNALIQRSTAIDTEMDAANANYSGQLQIANAQNQASALRAQAKAQSPGLLSLLGGAASTAGAYYGTRSILK